MTKVFFKALLPIAVIFIVSCNSGNDEAAKGTDNTKDSTGLRNIKSIQPDSADRSSAQDLTAQSKDSSKPTNSLVDAWVTIGTPSWGDDKHADDSWINPELIVNCTDGSKIVGKSEVRNGSPVAPGQIYRSHLNFSSGMSKINDSNISSIELSLNCMKPDFKGDYRRDDWDARNEVVFKFKDGKVLASGYNDPAIKIIFSDQWIHWNLYLINKTSPVPSARFFNHETLLPPVN